MIRKSADLIATLQAGNTVSRQKDYEGTDYTFCVCQTGETVHGQALNVLRRKELLAVVSYDMCGGPLEYGIVSA
jgi:hypothetical protein